MEPVLPPLCLKAFDLQTIVIHLGAASHGRLRSSYSRAIHAQVLEWFRLGQPEVSQAIHDSQESPISLSDLIGKHHSETVEEGDEFYFRIGLLNRHLLKPLLKGLERWGSASLVLAKFPFVLKCINLLPGTEPLVQSSNYVQLSQVATIANPLVLDFLSPTSFKLNQGKHIQPIPLPNSVFGNLRRRWNAFAPKELRFAQIQWDGLISDFDLRSRRLELDDSVELGTIGWVKYHFSDPQQARIANVLAHFAFFSGAGRKTAMGMGQVLLNNKLELDRV
jgi:CRISPR-associated endoribonuclease Cas6